MAPPTSEILTACRFYLEADGITNKMILEVNGLSLENPPASGDSVTGSTKAGFTNYQPTPTRSKFSAVTIKVVATTDTDLYRWYAACNTNDGSGSVWAQNRKALSVSAYDQAGTMKARWEVQNAYPSKYEGPSFTAGGGDLANESITVHHTGIKRVM